MMKRKQTSVRFGNQSVTLRLLQWHDVKYGEMLQWHDAKYGEMLTCCASHTAACMASMCLRMCARAVDAPAA